MVDDIIPFRPKSGQWFQGAREALSYTCGPSQRELAADSENLMDGAKNANSRWAKHLWSLIWTARVCRSMLIEAPHK